MKFIRQVFIIFVGSVTRVYFVVIALCITVVRITWLIVFQQRRVPNRCNAQFLKIIQVLDDSGNVSTVTSSGFASVCFFRCVWRVIIFRISVCKSIRHYQIHHIRRRVRISVCRVLLSLLKFVMDGFNGFVSVFEIQFCFLWLNSVCVNRYKKVVWIFYFFDFFDFDSAREFGLQILDIFSVN